jgi:hypothetical protein
MNNTHVARSSVAEYRLAFVLAVVLLGVTPGALAQDMSWEPESMVFESTPIGTTATQTLTLTNLDGALPLTINSIEWTWNQPGIVSGMPQFAFDADRPIPTILLAGESMTIDILFTPEEALTFASANLLVTNTSPNASSLNYWIEGMGGEADLCFPLVSCSGICTDLQIDPENCGDCGNVCPIPDNGSAFCESGTCSFTCNAGYMPLNDECIPIDPCYPFVDCSGQCVDLQNDVNNCGGCGNACSAPVNASAVCESANCSFVCNAGFELLDDECVEINVSIVGLTNLLINYWNAAVHEEPITIVGFGPGKSAVHRRDAIEDMLMRAREYVFLGMYDCACGQLRAAYLKTDGGYPFVLPPDFVAGEGVSGLNERIVAVVEGLDGLMPDGCPLPEPTTKPNR